MNYHAIACAALLAVTSSSIFLSFDPFSEEQHQRPL